MRTRWLVAIALLTACSGDDAPDDAASTTTSTVATEFVTVPPATTSPPPPSTTTTTIAVETPGEASNIYVLARARLDQAVQDPGDDTKVEAALAPLADPRRDEVRTLLLGYRRDGRFERPGGDTAPVTTVLDDTIVVEGDTVAFRACEVDTNQVIELDDAGAEVVVRDEPGARLVDVRVVLRDDAWLVGEITEVEAFPGATGCDGG